eukprot:TRINITY_DN17141_c0_g1_i1.p1 TRINITY_DN17141_c0_g1~~TRINITY_DN17141_c0_g1_i1.p1  ORF type:complete len:346 (-),score=56.13 TRINITY_DN17141_c0_g1_i1:13-1050(-)
MGCGCSSSLKVIPAEGVVSEGRSVTPVLCAGPEFNPPLDEDRIHSKYSIGEIVGTGAFGEIRKACLKKHPMQLRAVKVIELGSEEGGGGVNSIEHMLEVSIMQEMRHAHIIRFHECFTDGRSAYIVMELCSGGDLFQYLQQQGVCNEKDVAHAGRQIVLAINYIHSIGIVHRDIKAENIMLTGPSLASHVKLIDFGLACKFSDGQYFTEACGSIHYLAPEVITVVKYGREVDLWALGVLMYLLLYGLHPFHEEEDGDIAVSIVREPIRWQITTKVSSPCLHFMKQLLERNPWERSSAKQILEHPWISGMEVFDGGEPLTSLSDYDLPRGRSGAVLAGDQPSAVAK